MSKKSDLQLVQIVEFEFSKYDSNAVEAAKAELITRNLKEKELLEIRETLNHSLRSKTIIRENCYQISDWFKSTVSNIINAYDPVKPKKNSILLTLISSYLLISLISYFYSVFYFSFYGYNSYAQSLIEEVIVFLAYAVPVYGIIRKNTNAIAFFLGLLSFELAIHATNIYYAAIHLYDKFLTPSTHSSTQNADGLLLLIDQMIAEYNPGEVIITSIIGIIINGAIIWFFGKPLLMRFYRLNEEKRNKSLFFGFLLGFLFAINIINYLAKFYHL